MTNEQLSDAKKIANVLENAANLSEWTNNHTWRLYYNPIYTMLLDVMKLDCFAAQVAKSVYDRAHDYAKACRRSVMPKCSSKQAWCIACAAVENGINDFDYSHAEV